MGLTGPRIETARELPSSQVLHVHKDFCLVETHDKLLVLKSGVEILAVEDSGGEAFLNGTGGSCRVVSVRERSVFSSGDEGTKKVANLLPGESLLPCARCDVVLAFRTSGRYGEPCQLRAFTLEGNTLWELKLPQAPFAAVQRGNLLAVAAVDVASGPDPFLVLIHLNSGHFLWSRRLERGLWRNLEFTGEEEILAVLDSGAFAFKVDGTLLWKFTPKGKISSAAVGDGVVALATVEEFQPPLDKILTGVRLLLLSREGRVLWERAIRARRALTTTLGDMVLAATEDAVIAFSCKDGKMQFSKRLNHQPVHIAGDLLLLKTDGGYLLCMIKGGPKIP